MGNSTVLDLTVLLPSRRHAGVDVRVTAPPGTTFKDVRPVLGEVVGARSAHVSCQGRIVGDEAVVGVPPLVHGATLVLGEPVRSAGPAAGPIDLVVVAGPDAGRRCPVPPEGVVVGRSAGLGLSLDDERLSRRHVRIAPDDSGFRVTDLSSTNGTRCGTTLLAGDSCVVAGGEARRHRIEPAAAPALRRHGDPHPRTWGRPGHGQPRASPAPTAGSP